MESLIAVTVGWLFGILGQRPIEYIQQSIKKPAIKKGVISELKDVRFRLVATAYLLKDRIGELDKPFLEWMLPILKSYDGYFKYLETYATVEKLLKRDEEELNTLHEFKKVTADLSRGINVRKINFPFINSHYADMGWFPIEFQKNIIELIAQLNNFNEEIDNARFYFYKTFDSSLSEANADIIKNNLEMSYKSLIKMSENAAKNISKFIEAT